MKGKIKANTVDKYLLPIRKQIVDLIGSNSSVVELGCGNGDLLFHLSSKINQGIGYDNNPQLITYAKEKSKTLNLKHISFECSDLSQSTEAPCSDYSIASLFYHVMPKETAINLLKLQLKHAKTVIICGFSAPSSSKQSFLLWLDQRFSGHFKNFKEYQNFGYMEGLLNSIENLEYRCIDTFDPVIKIYCLEQLDKLSY
ncbi:Methyltransferase domain-containing protein [Lishizhenia tianjinensis]|uniref:Methyltransferase domain-containing protein n=1 Tax=Lishizhenia tianjinensis TaxID=477690 RepID=A0A1I6XV65_9FLAO|nr:class I SAM-dependent methyltransferase [Lishizhenia tianjinensis]SFT41903.1 Methyltransferase domain-containing protein [Lishizhenia tianjinensis]